MFLHYLIIIFFFTIIIILHLYLYINYLLQNGTPTGKNMPPYKPLLLCILFILVPNLNYNWFSISFWELALILQFSLLLDFLLFIICILSTYIVTNKQYYNCIKTLSLPNGHFFQTVVSMV